MEHRARLSLFQTENVGDLKERIAEVLRAKAATWQSLSRAGTAEKDTATKRTKEEIKEEIKDGAVSYNEDKERVTKGEFEALEIAASELHLSRFVTNEDLMKNSDTEDGQKKLEDALDGVLNQIEKKWKELKNTISQVEGECLHTSLPSRANSISSTRARDKCLYRSVEEDHRRVHC